jgi:hypothetical protein
MATVLVATGLQPAITASSNKLCAAIREAAPELTLFTLSLPLLAPALFYAGTDNFIFCTGAIL